MEKKRLFYADLLRVFAIFAVIFLHASANNWGIVPIASYEWQVFNVYDSLVRFCVPIFIMLSGMFFLDPSKQITIKNIYFKYIFRIVTAYIFWSAFYSVTPIIGSNILNKSDITLNSEMLSNIFTRFIEGHYHLWFLFMIVGLYIVVPILRKLTISAEKKLLEYFMILSLVLAIIIPTLLKFPLFEGLDRYIDKFYINLFLGYSGYFVSGYYFKTYEISKLKQVFIYIGGIIGIISTIILTKNISMFEGKANGEFYGYLNINVMLVSISVFVFFKELISKFNFKERTIKFITYVSSCSFGMYLVHDVFNIVFQRIGFSTLSFNPIFSVPIISITVFIGSFLIAYIMSKIPFVKKYLM